ncbi:hypothetical protein [Streptomyces sp. NPDC090798]|uniref:hypothetical protein n=1 Tax=Streptomyces sp. NPDC090798 TaxID=3365968 RepID=UPI003820B648
MEIGDDSERRLAETSRIAQALGIGRATLTTLGHMARRRSVVELAAGRLDGSLAGPRPGAGRRARRVVRDRLRSHGSARHDLLIDGSGEGPADGPPEAWTDRGRQP